MPPIMDSTLSHVIFIHKDVQYERLVPARFNTSEPVNEAIREPQHIVESLQPLLEFTDGK